MRMWLFELMDEEKRFLDYKLCGFYRRRPSVSPIRPVRCSFLLHSQHLLPPLQRSSNQLRRRRFVLSPVLQHHPQVADADQRVRILCPTTFSHSSARGIIFSAFLYFPRFRSTIAKLLTLPSISGCSFPSAFFFPFKKLLCLHVTLLPTY